MYRLTILYPCSCLLGPVFDQPFENQMVDWATTKTILSARMYNSWVYIPAINTSFPTKANRVRFLLFVVLHTCLLPHILLPMKSTMIQRLNLINDLGLLNVSCTICVQSKLETTVLARQSLVRIGRMVLSQGHATRKEALWDLAWLSISRLEKWHLIVVILCHKSVALIGQYSRSFLH